MRSSKFIAPSALIVLLIVGFSVFWLNFNNNSSEKSWSIQSEIAYYERKLENKENSNSLMTVKSLRGMELYETYSDFLEYLPKKFNSELSSVILYKYSPNDGIVELAFIEIGQNHCSFVSVGHLPKRKLVANCEVFSLPKFSSSGSHLKFSFDVEIIGYFVVSQNGIFREMKTNINDNVHFPTSENDVLDVLNSIL